jgi:hypothetical protein
MKIRSASILPIAIFFCCTSVAFGQDPYPVDCNHWITEYITCSDDQGGNQTECKGDITVIDYSDGAGTDSETNGTLMCSCISGGTTCGQSTCKNVSGWLIPQDNTANCTGGGGGGGGGGCCTCDNGECHAGCCTDVTRRVKASAAPTSGKPWQPTTRPRAANAQALISAADHRLSGSTPQEPTTTTGPPAKAPEPASADKGAKAAAPGIASPLKVADNELPADHQLK